MKFPNNSNLAEEIATFTSWTKESISRRALQTVKDYMDECRKVRKKYGIYCDPDYRKFPYNLRKKK